jgi:hypothetical protein
MWSTNQPTFIEKSIHCCNKGSPLKYAGDHKYVGLVINYRHIDFMWRSTEKITRWLNYVNRFVDISSRRFCAVDLTLYSTMITTFTTCFTIQKLQIFLHGVFMRLLWSSEQIMSVTKRRSSCLLLLKRKSLFHQQRQRKPENLCPGLGTLFSCGMWYYTGRFIMFSVITNIYNKKTKGPALMELFTATGMLFFFFFYNYRYSMCAPRVTRHTFIQDSSACHAAMHPCWHVCGKN